MLSHWNVITGIRYGIPSGHILKVTICKLAMFPWSNLLVSNTGIKQESTKFYFKSLWRVLASGPAGVFYM